MSAGKTTSSGKTDRDDPEMPRKLVEALRRSFPDNRPDQRPVHALGIAATGHFFASDVARDFCAAEHFQGDKIKVTIRFSNGSGSPKRRDGWRDVRGMATRFHLKNDKVTDLIAMTLSEFFTPTAHTFLDFSAATPPLPAKRVSPWAKICELLHMILPERDPYPGQDTDAAPGAIKFADANSYAQLPVFHAKMVGAPTSYARASYHAVHTFVIVAPDETRRWVRFIWQPVDGVLKTDPDATPDDVYLDDELRQRVTRSPPRFLLMMSIGEEGDDFTDATRPWPPRRTRIVMGTLTITGVPCDQAANSERISFNPWNLVPGIEPSEDPILRVRRDTYEFSRRGRGGACPFAGA